MALSCVQVENMFSLNVSAGDLGGAGYPALKANKMSGVKSQTTMQPQTTATTTKKTPTKTNFPKPKQKNFKALYDLEEWEEDFCGEEAAWVVLSRLESRLSEHTERG